MHPRPPGPPPLHEDDDARFDWRKAKEAIGLFRFIAPFKWHFAGGMMLLFLTSVVLMTLPYFSGEVVDIASGESSLGYSLDQIGLLLIVILVVQGVFTYFRIYLFQYVAEKGMANLSTELYQKLVTLPVFFFEENKVGELTSRMIADIRNLRELFGMALAGFFRQITLLVVGIGFLLITTPSLTLIMLGTFPVVVLLTMYFGKSIRRFAAKQQQVVADTNVVVEESLQNIQTVKVFTNEKYELFRYKGSIGKVVATGLKLVRYQAALQSFIIVAIFGGIFFILWAGAGMVADGEMTVGQLVSFITYTAIIGGAIGGLGEFFTQLLSALGGTERIRELLNERSEVTLSDDLLPKKMPCRIELKEVAFSYPSRRDVPVLKNINLVIEPGTKIALVGQSGSGKSTIAALLLRMYKTSTGRITINDRSIYDTDLVEHRSQFGIVPQEVMMFDGTIRDNILYGRIDGNEEELWEAVRQSYCLEFIERLPKGLDTLVGERGVKLSGGQRQRVAIARVMLKNPSILILDEATNSLDAESEKIVQAALDQVMQNRSSIVIAHRLSTIKNVDRIYVLDEGSIIETGSHEELRNLEHGAYRSLAKLQSMEG